MRFRRDLSELVGLASEGEPVYVTHKDGRFQVVPDNLEADRFSRITPLQIINPAVPELDDAEMKREMIRAWESDWEKI